MRKILFICLLLVPFSTFGQTKVTKNYTAPHFQGSVKIEDTLGVVNKLLVDTIRSFSSANIIISDTVTFSTNMIVDGDVILGNDVTDNITFNGHVSSDITFENTIDRAISIATATFEAGSALSISGGITNGISLDGGDLNLSGGAGGAVSGIGGQVNINGATGNTDGDVNIANIRGVVNISRPGATTFIKGATVLDNNAANTSAIVTFENTAGDIQLFRTDATPESSVIGSIGDIAVDGTNGFFYIKKSGSATNTGWMITGGTSTFKSYSLSNPGTAGTFYVGGHYDFAAADANLTIGGTVVQTFGTAGQAHGAHAFVVASGPGGTDLVLTVTGVSITDAGVKNDADSEILVTDADEAITDQYFETIKKWLGQITYTLTGASGSFDFNYGFVKYEDFGNRDFIVTDFEGTGEARANETGLNIELLHHEETAFIYHATAFLPNQTALISLATDYGTNNDVANGNSFAYKRDNLSTSINGNNGEGLIIRITTVVNNSINHASFHIGVTLK